MLKNFKVNKFFFASSSSIYGDQKPFPKKEDTEVNPINLYSLSKLSNEQLANSMSKIIKTKMIGLRFFTIYGPWGRPDMMILKYLIFGKLHYHTTKSIKLTKYANLLHERNCV